MTQQFTENQVRAIVEAMLKRNERPLPNSPLVDHDGARQEQSAWQGVNAPVISRKWVNENTSNQSSEKTKPFHMSISGSTATFTHCRFMQQAITHIFADPSPLTLTGTAGYIYVKYNTESGAMTVNYTTTAGTSYDAVKPVDEFTKGLIYEVSRKDTNSAWSVDVDSRMTGLNLALYV